MQVDDALTALDFDFAVMARGIQNERERSGHRADPMATLAKLKEKCTIDVESIPFGLN